MKKTMLKDKVIIITGGAGLIGRNIVKAIIENQGVAIVADSNIGKAKEVAEEMGGIAYFLDITSKESINQLVESVSQRYKTIDAVINNAYPRNENYGRKFEDVEYSDFCENLSLHLGGYFLVAQQLSLYFKKQGFGNIINMSSIYGVIAPRFEVYKGTLMTMPVEYAAIKSGLIHLTKYIAKYYKGNNIRCNAISLGGIEDNQPQSFLDSYKTYALNKGMLDPKDIIGTVIFLLSNMSQYINGQNIIVDDGWIL